MVKYIMDMEQPDGTFSIFAIENGENIRLNVFKPGQFERLIELPKDIQDKVKAKWTNERIAS